MLSSFDALIFEFRVRAEVDCRFEGIMILNFHF
jgi:hypothetical protein